jgi:uncharacterized protein (UPF0333 family)
MTKRGQAGIEYLILVGFVTLAVIIVFSIAIIYSQSIKDTIILNQVESFAEDLISSSEKVFFSGEPSKSTISIYVPHGVSEISFHDKELLIKTSVATGENIRSFNSAVSIQGSINPSEGKKILILTAKNDYVEVSENT